MLPSFRGKRHYRIVDIGRDAVDIGGKSPRDFCDESTGGDFRNGPIFGAASSSMRRLGANFGPW
jgi:hypothetical protein